MIAGQADAGGIDRELTAAEGFQADAGGRQDQVGEIHRGVGGEPQAELTAGHQLGGGRGQAGGIDQQVAIGELGRQLHRGAGVQGQVEVAAEGAEHDALITPLLAAGGPVARHDQLIQRSSPIACELEQQQAFIGGIGRERGGAEAGVHRLHHRRHAAGRGQLQTGPRQRQVLHRGQQGVQQGEAAGAGIQAEGGGGGLQVVGQAHEWAAHRDPGALQIHGLAHQGETAGGPRRRGGTGAQLQGTGAADAEAWPTGHQDSRQLVGGGALTGQRHVVGLEAGEGHGGAALAGAGEPRVERINGAGGVDGLLHLQGHQQFRIEGVTRRGDLLIHRLHLVDRLAGAGDRIGQVLAAVAHVEGN